MPEARADEGREEQFADEMKRILLLTSFAAQGPHLEVVSRTTSATTTSPAASAAMTASTSTKRARRSGCSARYATRCRRLSATTARAAWRRPSAPALTPPASHGEPNWMHDHRSRSTNLHDVPRQDPVGHRRRRLLLEPRVPRAQVAGDEPRCQGGRAVSGTKPLIGCQLLPARRAFDHQARWTSMEIRKSALVGRSAIETFDLIEAAEHYP